MTIHESTIAKLQNLPEPMVVEVDRFIESLINQKTTSVKPEVSAYELTKQWIGCADDLPEDLSHNKKYMEGYGQ